MTYFEPHLIDNSKVVYRYAGHDSVTLDMKRADLEQHLIIPTKTAKDEWSSLRANYVSKLFA